MRLSRSLAGCSRALALMSLFCGPALASECDAPARAAEQALGIPSDLLAAIGRVETGRPDGFGRLAAWPWSVNALGRDYALANAGEAVALVGSLRAQGVRSIDVGCFQVNLLYHPEAFASLADAFDPTANAGAAGHFLRALRAGGSGWEEAVARYHSANPDLGLPYLRQVMASWGHGPVALAQQAWRPVVWSPVASVRVIVPGTLGGTVLPWRANGLRLPVVITPSRAPP